MEWGKNNVWDRTQREAPGYARDKTKMGHLIRRLIQKARANRGQLRQIWAELEVLCRLLRDWHKGRYTQIPWSSLLWAITAALYFVNPFDLIPDFIPLVGFVDDAAVLGMVLRAIQKDVQQYQAWAEQQIEKMNDSRD
jgi:uncharacterized membrane protein YkvA (DUF1232 family)